MAWEQSPAARREQCSRQVHSCSPAPALPGSEEGAGCSISVSPAGRSSLRTEPPLGQDKMEVPKHAHSHGDTHTRTWVGEQVHTHLLELLSLSLVFDVTPSAKQPERSPSEGAWAGGTGAPWLSPSTAGQGQDSTGLLKNLQPSTHWERVCATWARAASFTLCWDPGTCRGSFQERTGRPGGPAWQK